MPNNSISSLSLPFLECFVWQMSGFFMIKDCQSKYLLANKSATRLLGYQSLDDISGSDDHHMKCEAIIFAEKYINEDIAVVKSNQPVTILYTLKFADDRYHIFLAHKSLIYIEEKYPAILCQGLFLQSNMLTTIANKLYLNTNPINDFEQGCFYFNEDLFGDVSLSVQQKKCLYYLLRGKTTKQIAEILTLSSRTTEHYIDHLKNKFTCTTKSELIDKALSLGYFYLLPEELLPL